MKKRPLPPNTKLHSEHAELVFKGNRFDTYQWQQAQFDGSVDTYEVIKRNDTVIVIAVIGEEIVIVKEQQPHWEESGFTFVSGMIHSDEDLEVAARRELEEETGLIFKDFYLVNVNRTAPSLEWFGYTFIATGYEGEKEKKLDAGEKTEVVRISFANLIEMTRKQKFLYSPRLIESMLLQDRVEDIKDMLKNPHKYSLPLE